MGKNLPLLAGLMAPAGQPQHAPQSEIPTALVRLRTNRRWFFRRESLAPIPIWQERTERIFPASSASKKSTKPRKPSRVIDYDDGGAVSIIRLQRARPPSPTWVQPALRIRGRVRAWVWLVLRRILPAREV